MKTLLLAFSAPLIGTAGQILLKYSMRQIGPVTSSSLTSPLDLVLKLLQSPSLLLAALLYCVGFVVWLIVLSKLDLSYAYPILALSYVLVPALSRILFQEQVSPLRWTGIAVICIGVIIVSRS